MNTRAKQTNQQKQQIERKNIESAALSVAETIKKLKLIYDSFFSFNDERRIYLFSNSLFGVSSNLAEMIIKKYDLNDLQYIIKYKKEIKEILEKIRDDLHFESFIYVNSTDYVNARNYFDKFYYLYIINDIVKNKNLNKFELKSIPYYLNKVFEDDLTENDKQILKKYENEKNIVDLIKEHDDNYYYLLENYLDIIIKSHNMLYESKKITVDDITDDYINICLQYKIKIEGLLNTTQLIIMKYSYYELLNKIILLKFRIKAEQIDLNLFLNIGVNMHFITKNDKQNIIKTLNNVKKSKIKNNHTKKNIISALLMGLEDPFNVYKEIVKNYISPDI